MSGANGLLARELAQRARVHISTARRWLRCGRLPWWLEELRWIGSDLGRVAEPWREWSLHGERLRSPEGELFTQADLRAVRVMRGQIAAYREALCTHVQADWVDGRYVIPAEPFNKQR
jgi:hypothetical protein